MREPLSKLVAQLDPAEFIRVHRSHAVRVSFIAELHPMFSGDYELVLRNGERLALSRRYKALLPAAMLCEIANSFSASAGDFRPT